MSKKLYFSISEALSFIESLKSKIERLPDLLGFKSADIGKNYKNLIQLANSLAIIFLQYDLHDMALVFLKYSADADLKLHRYGTIQNKLWEGSLVTYNNLIFLFHKVKHYKESLKLVYQAQNFVIKIREAKFKLSPEIELCTHFLSFISLWRVGRSSECVSYLQSATEILNKFIERKVLTKLSDSILDSLYGLIAGSLASVKLVVEKNKLEAVGILRKALSEISKDSGCRILLETLMTLFNENPLLKIPDESDEDWLCGRTFNSLLIATCFIPVLDPRTPIIRNEELESVREQLFSLENPEEIQGKFEDKDFFNRKIMVPKKKPLITEGSIKKIKPWWEDKNFLNQYEDKRSKNNASFVSEPRRRKRPQKVNRSVDFSKGIMFSPSNRLVKPSVSVLQKSLKQVVPENFFEDRWAMDRGKDFL